MTSGAADVAEAQRTPIKIWIGFVAMCIGMFMAILDIQIVVTSLPAIRDALSIPNETMSWIQTSYLIAEVIAIPLTGFLTRALSLRRLFLIALTVFILASFACASAPSATDLIVARVVQGFAGGCLIPLVFSAIFLLFPVRAHGIATTIAGTLAVLAPTLGPTVGGYITQTYSWPWLFLVNIGPGILALLVASLTLPRLASDRSLLGRIDWIGLSFLGSGLVALEIALKEGPQRGWASALVISLASLVVLSCIGFLRRSLTRREPIVDLHLMKDRNFAVGCGLSFLFGMGLFASVYLMPVFLGLVRGQGPLEIGLVMMVTGIAQLIMAPVVVQLELRVDARLLSVGGFLFFALGLAMSGFQTRETGFDEMFWPQVVRGAAIMLCLIPPTRLALDHLPAGSIPDGSALFNLMRNIGGAIGIALVDTIMLQRAPFHAEALGQRLLNRDLDAAKQVGIPEAFLPHPGETPSADDIAIARPLIEKAGLVEAINEAWLVVAAASALGILLLALAKPIEQPSTKQ